MFHANRDIVSRTKKRAESGAKGARARGTRENGSAGCSLSCDAARRLERKGSSGTFARRGSGVKGEGAMSASAIGCMDASSSEGSTRCSLTRAAWRLLNRNRGDIIVVRRGIGANGLVRGLDERRR
jgi:hypothetical protein